LDKTGFVKFTQPDRCFMFVSCPNDNTEYFAHFDVAQAGVPGGHVCLFQPGSPVNFSISTDVTFNNCGKPAIVDIELIDPPILEREESVIVNWQAGYGFAERVCPLNCRIFVGLDAVVTEGRLDLGTHFYNLSERGKDNRGRPRWKASDVEIIKSEVLTP
jgi:cold shock CspA family protein